MRVGRTPERPDKLKSYSNPAERERQFPTKGPLPSNSPLSSTHCPAPRSPRCHTGKVSSRPDGTGPGRPVVKARKRGISGRIWNVRQRRGAAWVGAPHHPPGGQVDTWFLGLFVEPSALQALASLPARRPCRCAPDLAMAGCHLRSRRQFFLEVLCRRCERTSLHPQRGSWQYPLCLPLHPLLQRIRAKSPGWPSRAVTELSLSLKRS